MTVKYNDLSKQWKIIEPSCWSKLSKFLQSGNYMDDSIKSNFEKKFIETFFSNSSVQSVGVSNGTTALRIALECLDLQGTTCVVIPVNTFISNALVASQLNYEIKLVDFNSYFQMNIQELDDFLKYNRDSYRNIVIMAVHLTGHPCDLSSIAFLANKYGCYIIEDCSQAHGTIYKGNVPVGITGDIATFSCYPTKNLGAVGEAGVIVSTNSSYMSKARAISRNGVYLNNPQYASLVGNNDRIDSLQCLIMSEKLKHIKDWNESKIRIAEMYDKKLNRDLLIRPANEGYSHTHTYHTYTTILKNKKGLTNLQLRDMLLQEYDIETRINYYPFIHNVPIYRNLKRKFAYADSIQDYIINLPMHPFITEEEIEYVSTSIEKCLIK